MAQEETERYRKEVKVTKSKIVHDEVKLKQTRHGNSLDHNRYEPYYDTAAHKCIKEAKDVIASTSPASVLAKYSHYLNRNENGTNSHRSNDSSTFFHHPCSPFHDAANYHVYLQPQCTSSSTLQHTANIADTNGEPKSYRFAYAAVPMSPKSAESYLACVCQQQDRFFK